MKSPVFISPFGHIPESVAPNLVYQGCNCGNSHLTILPDGSVMACRRVKNSVAGNALRDNLADLWLGPMEKYRQFDKFEKCSACELLAWCRGCPAAASAESGNFYAPDPQCWKNL